MCNRKTQSIRICLEQPRDYLSEQVGEGTLSLKFTGELNDKMKGFYRSKYYGPDGDERYGAVTQFEVCRGFFGHQIR